MKKQYAFTLIELMVAVSIFAATAVVLYSCLRGGILSYKRIADQARFQQGLRHAVSSLTKDLRNMFYMSNLPFQGDNESIGFVCLLSDRDGADADIAYVSYYLKGTEEDKTLIRNVLPLSHALSFSASQDSVWENAEQLKNRGSEQIILKGVSSLGFSYLAADPEVFFRDTEFSQGAPDYDWVDYYEPLDEIPIAVHIGFSISGPTGNKTEEFSRPVWVPAGQPFKAGLD
jgi:prepilin-type N-terminal cleavage/methylation domain-containing protein